MPVESGVGGKIRTHFSQNLTLMLLKYESVFIISLTYIHIENQTQYEASFIINLKKKLIYKISFKIHTQLKKLNPRLYISIQIFMHI